MNKPITDTSKLELAHERRRVRMVAKFKPVTPQQPREWLKHAAGINAALATEKES